MHVTTNREWVLRRRPVGEIADGDLVLRESPLRAPRDGEVLMRTTYLSLDPTNRIWMSDMDQYMEPVEVGDGMRGLLLGEVLESRHPAFATGDQVTTLATWTDYVCAPAAQFSPLPSVRGLEARDVFGIYSVVGPTAYFGLLEVGQPRIGETLVISTAAGAVGSIVGQIGKAVGCRVVGIAGGAEKCRWITEDLGFDAAIDYKTQDVATSLREHCPAGIDVYFDHVGGDMLDAVLGQMNRFGRVVVCGLIASYNATGPVPGPARYSAILMKRLRVQGFIIFDYLPRYAEAHRALTTLYQRGELKWRLHEVEGLENADQAVRLLYQGRNDGKLLVKVA